MTYSAAHEVAPNTRTEHQQTAKRATPRVTDTTVHNVQAATHTRKCLWMTFSTLGGIGFQAISLAKNGTVETTVFFRTLFQKTTDLS